MRPFMARSKRRSSNTGRSLTSSRLCRGTSIPAFFARCNATASQRTTSHSSLCVGNLAMASWPSASRTDALGRAPPSDEPGASNKRNAAADSDSLAVSTSSLAFNNAGSSTKGGIGATRPASGRRRLRIPRNAARRGGPCRLRATESRLPRARLWQYRRMHAPAAFDDASAHAPSDRAPSPPGWPNNALPGDVWQSAASSGKAGSRGKQSGCSNQPAS